MQDTTNLLKKRDVYIPNLIKKYKSIGDDYNVKYWQMELARVIARIKRRKKNGDKNIKQQSKWLGYNL